jgi:molecular chaperone IbpA|nr:MAG: molecular chaperone [Pseudomonadota bacterium]
MRHLDFAPLYRSTIGFDRLFRLLDEVTGFGDEAASYPPYNIERTGENEYRITMAVAGFGADEIQVEVKDTALTIRGQKKAEEKKREYLYRGIAQRSFERRFQLADYVEVKGASLNDGLLHIDLVRNLPERMRPRVIPIGTSAERVIEAEPVTTQH